MSGTPSNSLPRRVLEAPARRPWIMVALALLVGAMGLWAALRLEPDTAVESMLARDDPAAQALASLAHDFAVTDDLLMLVSVPEEDDSSEATRAQRLLDFAQRFNDAVEADAQARQRVVSVVWRAGDLAKRFLQDRVAPALGWYLDEEGFEALKHRLTPEGMDEQMARNRTLIASPGPAGAAMSRKILQDPLRLHELGARVMYRMSPPLKTWQGGEAVLSPDARALLIRVSGAKHAGDMDFTKPFMQSIRAAVAAAGPGELHIDYGGSYAIAELAEREIRADMIRSVVGSIVLLQIIFLLIYRNPFCFPIAFAPVALGVVVAFALCWLFRSKLTPVTAVGGAVLAGLGIDYCIHYLSHYEMRRAKGDSALEATQHGVNLVGALAAACVASLVAFAAILFARVPALHEFGQLGILGLGASFLAALTLLPALLRLTDRRQATAGSPLRLDVEPLMHFTRGRAKHCLIAMGSLALAAAAVSAVSLTGSQRFALFETSVSVMHPQPNPPLETRDRVAERFGGSPHSLVIYLRADDPDDLLRLAHRVDERLDAPSVRSLGLLSPFGLASMLPDPRDKADRAQKLQALDPQQIQQNFQSAVRRAGFSPKPFAKYEAYLRQLVRPDDPPGVSALAVHTDLARSMLPTAALGEQGRAAQQAVTLVPLAESLDDRQRRQTVIDGVRDAMADLPGATLTGIAVLGQDAQNAVREDLGRLLALAGIVVLIWLGIVFRHPRDVLLALLPTAFGCVFVLAVMCLAGVRLNMINLIALPLLAGLGVDDGIFLVSGFRRRLAGAHGDLLASAHAVTMTSLTTGLAFGSLAITSVPAIRSLGILLAVGIAACWLATVFLLAPLLFILIGRSEPRTPDAP